MNRRRVSDALATTALLAGELLGALFLRRLGRVAGFSRPPGDLEGWLRSASTEDLLATSGRLVALAVFGWLLAGTLASVLRRAVPRLRGSTWLDALSAPCVRRLLDRTLAMSLGATVLLGPTAAGASDPGTRATSTGGTHHPVVIVGPDGGFSIAPAAKERPRAVSTSPARRDRPETLVIRSADPLRPATSSTRPPTSASTATTTPAASARGRDRPVLREPAGAQTAPRQVSGYYAVRAGDSLWLIAQRTVTTHAGEQPQPEVSRYWTDLVEANRSTLRSGDPSLIFPGELLVLPPVLPA